VPDPPLHRGQLRVGLGLPRHTMGVEQEPAQRQGEWSLAQTRVARGHSGLLM